jgi:hypothetical protein
MNDLFTKWFGSSWRTTIGGAMVGIPPLVFAAAQAASLTFGHWTLFALTLVAGIGALILGGNAKDAQVHSSVDQVEAKTATVEGKANASALVKAADAQVAAQK